MHRLQELVRLHQLGEGGREVARKLGMSGRLRMDNNHTENTLRKVVKIRDVALFAGSDDHAVSAGHILSLVASARLHDLDPEA